MDFLDEVLKRNDTPEQPDALEDDDAYKAFQTEKRPETLELRLSADDGEIFDYMMIRPVSYRLGKIPERITVYTTAGRILIKGRNLRELAKSFTRRNVAYVQLYEAARFGPLADDLPCIEVIDFAPLDSRTSDEKPKKTHAASASEPA